MKPRLSAFVVTHNEAAHIGPCLASLGDLPDEIVVLDDGSTDATAEMARAHGARVEHRAWDNFARQKQAALELTRGEWVFLIDADERASPALLAEMRSVLASGEAMDGYWVRRELIYMGARLRYGGTGGDWVIRLARREQSHFGTHPVHAGIEVSGATRRLRGTMDHLQYTSLAEHITKMNSYTDYIARHKREQGKRGFSPWQVSRVFYELFVRLVLRGGFLDGSPGVIWAVMASYAGFLKYAKLWRAPEPLSSPPSPRA